MRSTRPGFLLMVVVTEAVILFVVSGCEGKEITSPTRLTFAAVSAGSYYTCGVTTGGAAYCWGENFHGQFGNGTIDYVPHETPVPVSGGLTFAAVSAGYEHICGLTQGGAAYCWGDNTYGQLGNGSTIASDMPVSVSGGLNFVAVTAGGPHACGVTTGGAAYCWGDNTDGQLGNGTTSSSSTPVAVSGGLTFASLSAGGYHTCGLTQGGAAYCWGLNYRGELGIASGNSSSVPAPVAGGLSFVAVSAGGVYYACGVTTGGAAYCWGDNTYGQLGNGTTSSSSTPVAVSGGLTFAAVSAGYQHTCGLTQGGVAYCWGQNISGELGLGPLVSNNGPQKCFLDSCSVTPLAVSGGFAFATVSIGSTQTCGLTIGGTAYCWGGDFGGESGNGSHLGSAVPLPVLGQ